MIQINQKWLNLHEGNRLGGAWGGGNRLGGPHLACALGLAPWESGPGNDNDQS